MEFGKFGISLLLTNIYKNKKIQILSLWFLFSNNLTFLQISIPVLTLSFPVSNLY